MVRFGGGESRRDRFTQNSRAHKHLKRAAEIPIADQSFGGSFKDNIGSIKASIKSSILMDDSPKIRLAWKREFDKHDERRIHKSTLWRTGFYDDYIKHSNEKASFNYRQSNRSQHGMPPKPFPKRLERDFLMELINAIEDTFDTVDWLKGTENEQSILREFLEKHKAFRNDDVEFYDALVRWNRLLDDAVAKYKREVNAMIGY